MINKNICVPTLVFILSIILVEIFRSSPKHPYSSLDIIQLVNKYGYPIETHEVVSEDGYILTLHRIPHGREETSWKNKIPVLFMHGFSQSAKDFVNLGPKNALSFLLVEKGYDVWLGNARGTTWSRKHKYLNPDKDKKFWEFSLDEIGYYDVPAFIDYILQNTNQKSLHYIGYSQGTSVFFMMGSERPQYMKKIKLMTALAPAIFLKDPVGPALATYVYSRKLLEFFSIHEYLSEDSLVSMYMRHICNEDSLFVDLCLQHTFYLHGFDYDEVNKTELSLIFSNTPAGVSSRQILHLAELMHTGNFQHFDLGFSENMKKYGQPEPPMYNLSRISAPVALYYAINDWTINIKNIDKVLKTLPNVVKAYKIPSSKFNHNDFINAINVVNLLYNEVIAEIISY